MDHEFAKPDPAAIVACVISLWNAYTKPDTALPRCDLSGPYNGFDEFMRKVAHAAEEFEAWACSHIDFAETLEVWPYFLEEHFGPACIHFLKREGLMNFNNSTCLQVALRMRLPVRLDMNLPIPMDVSANNPVAGSAFVKLRIRTCRTVCETDEAHPFTIEDDPFDEAYDSPHYALYGVYQDGTNEYITDRPSLESAVALASKIAPRVSFVLKGD